MKESFIFVVLYSETMAKLDAALETTSKLEAKLKEMDFSLSVLESIGDEDENTDS